MASQPGTHHDGKLEPRCPAWALPLLLSTAVILTAASASAPASAGAAGGPFDVSSLSAAAAPGVTPTPTATATAAHSEPGPLSPEQTAIHATESPTPQSGAKTTVPTLTPGADPSGTATTATATSTASPSATTAPTPADKGTATGTPAPSQIPTQAATPRSTGTATPAETPTPTPTPIPRTATPTQGATATATATPAPGTVPNDDFDGATIISGFPYSASMDTTKATSASDDPDVGIGDGRNSRSVWFAFTASSAGGAHVNTYGSSYDTVLAAFTGARGNLVLVAVNDDSGDDRQSEIGFNVESGRTYYIEVAEYGSGSGGSLRLSATLGGNVVATSTATVEPTYTPWPTYTPTATVLPSANDDIGGATTITALPFTTSLDTAGATTSGDDPAMGEDGAVNSNTVWYRYTPSAAGAVRASTQGSDYDTVLAVFTGNRGNLVRVADNDDSGQGVQSEVTFAAQAGVTYWIEVAQYGSPGGGSLLLTVDGPAAILATPSATVLAGTPVPGVVGALPGYIPPAPVRAQPAIRDERYFAATGYRIDGDAFWDFYHKRGGVRTFGYPVSWEFPMLGFTVQFFQRGILQLIPGGGVATMNLLDDGLMPYTQINFSTYPAPEPHLVLNSSSPGSPEYGAEAIAFVREHVPDEWNGMQVDFLRTYMSTVRFEDAFPDGDGVEALVPLLNLELLGLPTSKPAYDPNNHGFVYQRFQRGILQYDVNTGSTQGLLLADYLKGIITGKNVPEDLDKQSSESRFYRQYAPGMPGWMARPGELAATNLEGAFEPSR